MGTINKGWVELDGKRLIRVKSMTVDAGRVKTKVTPAGSDEAKDTAIGAKTCKGTLVIYGTNQNGYEFDWLTFCQDESKHTLVRHFSSLNRMLIKGVEFSTLAAPLAEGDNASDVTLNFEADGAPIWE